MNDSNLLKISFFSQTRKFSTSLFGI